MTHNKNAVNAKNSICIYADCRLQNSIVPPKCCIVQFEDSIYLRLSYLMSYKVSFNM